MEEEMFTSKVLSMYNCLKRDEDGNMVDCGWKEDAHGLSLLRLEGTLLKLSTLCKGVLYFFPVYVDNCQYMLR
jgi:hypothetical protein